MRSRFIFLLLRVSTIVLFYLLIIFSVVFLVISLSRIFGINKNDDKMLNSGLTYEVLAFGTNKQEQPLIYSQDSVAHYQDLKDHYTLQVKPDSAMGYYCLIMQMIFLGLGISILWNFKRIFRDTKLNNPFRHTIVKRLSILAALFIISDILKLVDYFLFNNFLHQSITSPRFQLLTDTGNGIITGLIILVIATIYQRGVALQEENALTV